MKILVLGKSACSLIEDSFSIKIIKCSGIALKKGWSWQVVLFSAY